jgi:uncharacterized protein
MRRFWFVLYTVTGLAHLIFALGMSFAARRLGAPAPALFAAVIALALAASLRGRVRRGARDLPMPAWRLLLIEEPYYVHWCASLAGMLLFIPCALIAVLRRAFMATGSLTEELGALALLAYLAALVLAFYGVWVRRRWVRVRTIDVAIAGLGPGFDGYRVAQLSDLHIGGLWPRGRAQRWADRVNRLDADLIALTGDYVTSGTAFHADIVAVLSSMRAKDGAVAVMGNHDYFGDGEPLISMLRERGVVVLRNEHMTIERAGDRITIAGVDDTWTRRADVARALRGRDEAAPLIALAHDPRLFPELAQGGARLVLSGHTHWGQVALPFLSTRVNLSRLSYRYHAGIYHSGDATLYVNPGLGTTGPPIRLGAPPEITVLRLRRAEPR